MRVLEQGGRAGLDLEPVALPRVDGRGVGEHLQRHPPAQRDLLGLVDDRHAAAADLAEQAEVAQDAEPRLAGRRIGSIAGGTAGGRRVDRPAQAGHHRHRGEEFVELFGLLGITEPVGVEVDRLAGL